MAWVGLGIAALGLLPGQWAWLATTAAIIVLGVPHGALDGEVARGVLRPRMGRAWFLVFAVPYMMLAALVLVLWRVSPVGMLVAFLLASVWHFGCEEAGPGRFVWGGLPVAVPVLLHPAGTWAVFSAALQVEVAGPPVWLVSGSVLWALVAAGWVAWRGWRQGWGLAPLLGFGLVFAVLPPLSAFAVYFVCRHAPAHMRAVIADRVLAPRVDGWGAALWLALPWTVLTVLIGAALWPLYGGTPAVRLLGLTLQGLSALTLPHMVLEAGMSVRERRVGHVMGSVEAGLHPAGLSRAGIALGAGTAALVKKEQPECV